MKTDESKLAPIVLFVYNRPWHTQQTVEALLANELAKESILYVFADGAKPGANAEVIDGICKTREYIHQISGFKSIYVEEAETNKGLANSVIRGVSKVIDLYGKAIVLEDDLITNKFFLRFMNEALEFYQDDMRLFMVSGCNYDFKIPNWYEKDVYIAHRSCSTGWGTWKNRWDLADWDMRDYDEFKKDASQVAKFCRGGDDMFPMLEEQIGGKIDSWAIRWDYCMYKHDAFCLRTVKTLVNNIGFDGSGVHCGNQEVGMAPNYDYPLYQIEMIRGIKAIPGIDRIYKKHYSPRDKNGLSLYKKKLKSFAKMFLKSILLPFFVFIEFEFFVGF